MKLISLGENSGRDNVCDCRNNVFYIMLYNNLYWFQSLIKCRVKNEIFLFHYEIKLKNIEKEHDDFIEWKKIMTVIDVSVFC